MDSQSTRAAEMQSHLRNIQNIMAHKGATAADKLSAVETVMARASHLLEAPVKTASFIPERLLVRLHYPNAFSEKAQNGLWTIYDGMDFRRYELSGDTETEQEAWMQAFLSLTSGRQLNRALEGDHP